MDRARKGIYFAEGGAAAGNYEFPLCWKTLRSFYQSVTAFTRLIPIQPRQVQLFLSLDDACQTGLILPRK